LYIVAYLVTSIHDDELIIINRRKYFYSVSRHNKLPELNPIATYVLLLGNAGDIMLYFQLPLTLILIGSVGDGHQVAVYIHFTGIHPTIELHISSDFLLSHFVVRTTQIAFK